MKESDIRPKEQINPYLEYSGRPIILGNIKEAMGMGKLKFEGDGMELKLPSHEKIKVSRKHQFNRVEQTINELNEVIDQESPLYEDFKKEVLSKNNESKINSISPLGVAVYYPEREDLVFYAPSKWHKNALILRNSLLIRDPKQEISWHEQRKIFDSLVIGVAGASVGKNAFMRIIDTIRPNHMKIADPKTYKDSNSNRAELAYWDIGVNKAIVASKQVHRNDPFTDVSVYSEGLSNSNMEDFVGGSEIKNEPPLNYLVEETDDPIRKIESLKFARKHRIPFCMITDIGSGYQIDFRDFKKYPNLPLMYGVKDEEIFETQSNWQEDKRNVRLLVDFAFKLIGNNWKDVPEFRDFVLGKYKGVSKELPQLGVAANAGGSHLAVTIAKHALGAEIPERFFVNLASREIHEEGNIFDVNNQ